VIWLTWRQLRVQLVAVWALVAAACVLLAATGPHLARLARDNVDVYDLLSQNDLRLFDAGIAVLAVAPPLVGIFWGGPLVARELESGTHLLAWTQSVTRGRWLATKLGLPLLSAAVAVGVLTLAVTWWAHPLDGEQGSARGNLFARMTPVAFAMRGVVPVAYTVFALLLAALLGLVLRRSVAAMALALAVYVLVQVAVPLWVRPHLVAPTTQTVVLSHQTLDGIMLGEDGSLTITAHTQSPRDWVLSNRTVDSDGRASALPSWFAGCVPPRPPDAGDAGVKAQSAPGSIDDCLSRLTGEGYRQRLVYQPDHHFWRLQWTEAGLYLVVSAGLATLSFWWVRRRLA
jgi:ABC-type transport system involved in multi-copper enzyme maturation permease subunit